MDNQQTLFQFLLRQGDNALILGQRLSEWCGTGPTLEEDIALTNTALDLIGQTQLWLGYAAEVKGGACTANELAFFRDAYDFYNLLMLEVPNNDYARTMVRQFLFDQFQTLWLNALCSSTDTQIANIAEKSLKEAQYHLERSEQTIIALGDGTQTSNNYMQSALNHLWPYVGEMFEDDGIDHTIAEINIAPLPSSMKKQWQQRVDQTLSNAHLHKPTTGFAHSGGRTGFRHTEHLGHMLAIMQSLPRAHPDARW